MKKIDLFLEFRKLGGSRSRGLHSMTHPVLSQRRERVTDRKHGTNKAVPAAEVEVSHIESPETTRSPWHPGHHICSVSAFWCSESAQLFSLLLLSWELQSLPQPPSYCIPSSGNMGGSACGRMSSPCSGLPTSPRCSHFQQLFKEGWINV